MLSLFKPNTRGRTSKSTATSNVDTEKKTKEDQPLQQSHTFTTGRVIQMVLADRSLPEFKDKTVLVVDPRTVLPGLQNSDIAQLANKMLPVPAFNVMVKDASTLVKATITFVTAVSTKDVKNDKNLSESFTLGLGFHPSSLKANDGYISTEFIVEDIDFQTLLLTTRASLHSDTPTSLPTISF